MTGLCTSGPSGAPLHLLQVRWCTSWDTFQRLDTFQIGLWVSELDSHPLQIRVVRIFNTYGPRMALDDGRVVSNFVAQALMDQPLTVYGDGQQTRSFQYVSDLIRGEAGWCFCAQSHSSAHTCTCKQQLLMRRPLNSSGQFWLVLGCKAPHAQHLSTLPLCGPRSGMQPAAGHFQTFEFLNTACRHGGCDGWPRDWPLQCGQPY